MRKGRTPSSGGLEGHKAGRFLPDVLDSLSDAVIVADIDSLRVEYANRSVGDALDYTPDALIGEPIVVLYPDDDGAAAFRRAVDDARHDGTPGFRSEQVFARRDGGRTWTEMTTRLVPEHAPEKLVCVLRDITERKLWEDALVQSHARLELLNSILSGVKLGMSVEAVIDLTLTRLSKYFQGVRVSYCTVDDSGTLIATNSVHPEAMPSLVGTSNDLNRCPAYMSSLRAGEPVVVADLEQEPEGYAAVMGEGTRAVLHVPMEHTQGLVAVMCLDSRLPLPWSVHAITTVTEVASHLSFVLKDAEASKTRMQLEEQLRQSQKMEAVGRLAGGVAHDFNNILTGITGYVELVLAQLDEPQARRDLEQIRRFSDRAAGLTHQLLAFSRRQPLLVSAVDLNQLVSSTMGLIERLIGEDIDLRFEPGAELAAVEADSGQIEQVLMNLAVNSRDAMSGGGRLLIETCNVYLDHDYARSHSAVDPGQYVMLSVSDTGVGMDSDSQERAFEPFFTTKEQGKGTGLGLSTVYGIVKQHEGNIWVYSEPGRGTCFKIYFPVSSAKPVAEVADQVGLRVPRGDETILLVEDEPRVRDAVKRALENYGYTVLSATHPDEATTVFGENARGVDMLLSDVVMPGCDGIQLHDRLCVRRPGLPVLFMSGYTDRSILEDGILEPGVPFIQKPFSPAQLVRKVRSVLDVSIG
jgi:PAS domain S-box-containing protein